jgi:hypothetical protein
VADSYDHDIESSGFIKVGKFLEQLSDYHLLKDTATRS